MFSSSDKMIYLRDVTERFKELRDERQTLEAASIEAQEALAEADDRGAENIEALEEARDDAAAELTDWSDQEEHDSLKSLLEDLADYGGDHQWEGSWYPVTLIADDHFEDYAREFAEDIGAINGNERWPATCIDWEKAAGELQMDYSSVTWEGREFWYR